MNIGKTCPSSVPRTSSCGAGCKMWRVSDAEAMPNKALQGGLGDAEVHGVSALLQRCSETSWLFLPREHYSGCLNFCVTKSFTRSAFCRVQVPIHDSVLLSVCSLYYMENDRIELTKRCAFPVRGKRQDASAMHVLLMSLVESSGIVISNFLCATHSK